MNEKGLKYYEQYEKNYLDKHQYIDQASLDYIKRNKPQFSSSLTKRKIKQFIDISNFQYILTQYCPSTEWYLVKDELSTIHGLRHIMRTMVFTQLLCEHFNMNELKKVSAIVASIHDTHRENDFADFKHGKRAAEWFKNNYKLVCSEFDIDLNEEERSQIYYAVFHHSDPYNEINDLPSYKKHKNIIDLFKVADGIDRYRLPKVSLWMGKKYLKLFPSEDLMHFGFNLFVCSEQIHLNSGANEKSVSICLERCLKNSII